ncbi:MAG: S-formylglutathione hydrolase, partial [Comamonas sp.]|nr:S-formylglutathione hydrolase [Comamonas sp.]
VPGQSDAWDFGVGAGFYLNAQQAPWEQNWRMESYIIDELLPMLGRYLPIDMQRLGIFGHSMGGHGALTLALRHPGTFKSVSAFAPITNPSNCAWGQKAFTGYLGGNEAVWAQHDATRLMESQGKVPYPAGILIDQGMADKFLHEKQLLPEAFEAACAKVGQPLVLRQQAGYDHGYYFIQTFMDDHLRHHAQQLGQ